MEIEYLKKKKKLNYVHTSVPTLFVQDCRFGAVVSVMTMLTTIPTLNLAQILAPVTWASCRYIILFTPLHAFSVVCNRYVTVFGGW